MERIVLLIRETGLLVFEEFFWYATMSFQRCKHLKSIQGVLLCLLVVFFYLYSLNKQGHPHAVVRSGSDTCCLQIYYGRRSLCVCLFMVLLSVYDNHMLINKYSAFLFQYFYSHGYTVPPWLIINSEDKNTSHHQFSNHRVLLHT